MSPTGDAVLLAEPEAYPPIALLAEPVLRLGGVRISPATGCRQRTFRFTGLQVQPVAGGPAVRVALPAAARIGLPVFSHDGRRFAFARDLADGVELWAGETATGAARPVPASGSTTSSVRPSRWTGGGTLLVADGPGGPRRRRRRRPPCRSGPIVEETAGKASQMATFQDLLRTPHDEAVFEHYARAQLALVDAASGTATPLGAPGLFADVEPSPDGRYLLVQRGKAAVLDPGPLLLLRAHDRGVGRGGQAGGHDRRPAGVGRGAAAGRARRARARWRGSRSCPRRSSGSRPWTAATRRGRSPPRARR